MATAKELVEHTRNLKILYVEDDTLLRRDTHRLLSAFFQVIDVAVNGREALDIYRPELHDLVISDLMMPEMNGAELASAILARNPKQIVIVLSAHDEFSIVQKLKQIGVSNLIFKPLDIRQFIDVLDSVCKNLVPKASHN